MINLRVIAEYMNSPTIISLRVLTLPSKSHMVLTMGGRQRESMKWSWKLSSWLCNTDNSIFQKQEELWYIKNAALIWHSYQLKSAHGKGIFLRGIGRERNVHVWTSTINRTISWLGKLAKSLFIFLFLFTTTRWSTGKYHVTLSQCHTWSRHRLQVTVGHMMRVTWESKRIATVVKCISSREISENSIEFSLSNSEQRDSWLNSSHWTLDTDRRCLKSKWNESIY